MLDYNVDDYEVIFDCMINESDVVKKFDIDWYKRNYGLNDNESAIVHFLSHSMDDYCNPNIHFDTKWYLDEYPDVKYNPFVHYLKQGYLEGRLPKLYSLDEIKSQNLKSSLRGRKGYYFLINDTNFELMQHYDVNYDSNFDKTSFSKDLAFKREIFEKNNIDYYFFFVPDKSVVCKEYLPFKFNNVRRNIDGISDIPDFTSKLIPIHYYKCDSHMNFDGGNIISYNIINYLDSSVDSVEWNNLIQNNGEFIEDAPHDDLSWVSNWSYSEDERNNIDKSNVNIFKPNNIIDLENEIPENILFSLNRKSRLFLNENSKTNLRVLIFHDSSINMIFQYLSVYFREMFLFWDHGLMDKETINWYKPDIVLEVRIERFLEYLPVPDWVKNRDSFRE